ncbi:hypothetical protein N431DRAFT_352142 [Stipitochalara longipes BDJ]|nr:hypothetical protein N431DRAFT_352142 [Stipitochalara longipes BDJ]
MSDFCTYDKVHTEYGSFRPWPKSILNRVDGPLNSNIACWYYADCIFSQLQDTRKQQYSAISLVMGLIPLILKDVAWPQRRIAEIPYLQPWYTEILVRALGLNPVVQTTEIPYGREFKGLRSWIVFLSLFLGLLSTYGALAVIEVFSKRSALGCPYPVWVMTWFIISLVPATIEVAASRFRNREEPSRSPFISPQNEEDLITDNTKAIEPKVTISEAIPGSHEQLFVQFSWAVYYTAGTLVFSSIMLVTVLELIVWVTVTCAATAASKMFAYKLCGYWGSGFK